jgi:predicted nucleic acid-binding protein
MRRKIIPNATNNSLVSMVSSKQLQTLDRRTMNNQNKKQLKNQRLKNFMQLKKTHKIKKIEDKEHANKRKKDGHT